MPQFLRLHDFRARRIVRIRRDFLDAQHRLPWPTDKIDETTWESIVGLPDDVAVRTSNYHGGTLRQLDDLWSAWVESVGDEQDTMFSVMLDAGDDFQAATYNALTGFYRLSASALRSALELTAIGTWLQVCGKQAEYAEWRNGNVKASFGQACDGLCAATGDLRFHVRKTVDDSLFDQKTSRSEGGFARRTFDGISNFTHSRPGSTDGDIRESNGPIYVRSAFNHFTWMQFETLGLCFVLVLLARPRQAVPIPMMELFQDVKRLKSRVTRAAFEFLHTRSTT